MLGVLADEAVDREVCQWRTFLRWPADAYRYHMGYRTPTCMIAMPGIETFFQQYIDGDSRITVYWGICSGEMVFLVFDRTNGRAEDASFRIQAGNVGNIGILTTMAGERVLADGDVVEITDGGVEISSVPLSEIQFLSYLDTAGFPLGIAGVRSFSET